jgi:low affinity Fe/Cu permease
MYSTLIMRVSSQILSALLGGMAVFCLFYAGEVANAESAWQLLANTAICGGLATGIVFCQNKYLN